MISIVIAERNESSLKILNNNKRFNNGEVKCDDILAHVSTSTFLLMHRFLFLEPFASQKKFNALMIL